MIMDQAQALRNLVTEAEYGTAAPGSSRPRPAKIVAVTSGKGGVGKTNMAVNLAVRLAIMGRRVVLLDADLGTANADLLCNMAPRHNLAHVIAGRCRLEDAMVQGPGGFQLIAGASGLAQVAAMREAERARIVDQVRRLEVEADLILIDTGAGVSPNVLGFAAGADQVLVVTTPDPTAITDAYALIKTVHRRRRDIDVRVLVNMVQDPEEGRGVFDRIQAVCEKFLALTPRYADHVLSDVRVAMAVRDRQPFVISSPGCEASACITRLAHRMDRHARDPHGEGLLRRMAFWRTG